MGPFYSQNYSSRTGCVAGKYGLENRLCCWKNGLENRLCLLENRGWKLGCVWYVIAGYGLTC